MTNDEIIAAGQQIYDETEVAANTSERVGGVIKGIGQNLADKDTTIAAQAARNGYYQCTVSGTTLAVSAPGFTLPAHGGNIRIKMSAPATGACTLNINSTGPKTLLYNGAAVSSANTWEQDEIITVFYDPSGSGQYLASNCQGGGGQFGSGEKIKDVLLSQVLGAGTDTIMSQKSVSEAIFNEIDISSIDTLKTLDDALAPSSSLKPTYYTVTAMLSSTKLKVGSMAVISDNMRHVVTQIIATHYLLDDAGNLTNEHSDAEIFLIYRSVKLSGGTLPDAAGVWTKWRYVNSSVWSTTAEKIKYDNSASGLASDNVQGAVDEVQKNIDSATLWYGEENFDLSATTPVSSNTNYIVASKVDNGFSFRIVKKDTATGRTMSFNLPILTSGKRYTITFNYTNNLGTTPDVTVRDSSDKAIKNIGKVYSGSGIFKAEFTYESNMVKVLMYTVQNAVGLTLTFTDISIKETIHIIDVAPYASLVPGIYNDIHDVQEITERIEDPVYDAWGSSTQKRRYISYNCASHGRFAIKFTDNRFATQVIASPVTNNINNSIVVMPGDNKFEYANKEYSFEWDDARVNYIVIVVRLKTDTGMTDAQIAAFKASMTVEIEDLDGYNGLDKRVDKLEELAPSTQSFIDSEKENKKDYPNVYEGNKIAVRRNTFACHTIGNNIFKSAIGDYAAAQGQVIFGDYCFRFHCAPQASALNSGYCTVYNISNPDDVKFINGFVFETDTPVHCNAAQFAPNIEEGHDFPLCYMSGNYSAETYVIRFSLNDGIFSGEVIQHITFTTGGNNIIGEDGFLWGVSGSNGILKAYKYPCPNPYIGDVSYTTDDLVDSFEVPIENIATWQGTMIYSNKIYMLFGTKEGAYTVAKRCFMVIDAINHTLDSVVNLNALITEEPEDIDIWKDKIVLGCNANCSYLLSFH